MIPLRPVPPALLDTAARQGGVVTRGQVAATGLSDEVLGRLCARGTWSRLDRGLYVVDGSPSYLSHVHGALLLGGEYARTWTGTAAYLDGLCDVERYPVQVLVPEGMRIQDRPWVRFSRERTGVRAPSAAVSPRRTRVEDTVLDVAASLKRDDVLAWVDEAVFRRLTTTERLRVSAARRSRLRHRGEVLDALRLIDGGVRSELERLYRDTVERAHRLPPADRQRVVGGHTVDVHHDRYALVVELDGRLGHRGDAGRHRDRRRDNRHTVDRLASLRYGWTDVRTDPCGCAQEVGAVLRDRGWTGRLRRCRRCLEKEDRPS